MKTIKNIKLRKINKPDMLYFLRWWKDKKLVKLTSGVYEKSDVVLKRYFLSNSKNKKNVSSIHKILRLKSTNLRLILKNL